MPSWPVNSRLIGVKAGRLEPAPSEQRLNAMPEGTGVFFGSMRKAGEETWTSVDE